MEKQQAYKTNQTNNEQQQQNQIPSDNLDGRPSTALKQRRNIKSGLTTVNNNNNQNDSKCMFPDMNQKNNSQSNFDQRAQSAGGFSKTLQFSNKFIKPQYQELGFQAPQKPQNLLNGQESNKQNVDASNKDYKRIIPKSMLQDKEQLYEELLKTKSIVHLLEMENNKLKTKVQFQEKEINKSATLGYDSQNDDIISTTNGNAPGLNRNKSMMNFKSINLSENGFSQSLSQTSLIPNLKKQVKMLNDEISRQKLQMQQVQRNIKLTKISELEVELKTYQDETIRLKQMLQQALNAPNGLQNQNLEEKYINMQNKNVVLHKEVKKYQVDIEALKEEINNLKNKIKEQERASYKLTKQKNQLEKINLRKEKDLDRYRTQDPQYNLVGNYKKNQIGQSETQLKQELEKKLLECNQMNTNYTKLKKDFQEFQKQTKQKTYALEEELKYYKQVVQEQENQIEKSQNELQEYKKKYTQVIGANQQQTNLKKQKPQSLKQTGQVIQSEDNKFTLEDVQNLIGYDLKYKLQLKKIDSTSFDRFLFNQENLASNNITASELLSNLKKDPFTVPEDNRMNILLKYLILDEDERTNALDLNQGQMTDVVKKKFQEVIFNFKKLKYEDEKLIRQNVHQQINNNQVTIQKNIDQCQLDETGIVDSQVCRRTIFIQALNVSGFDSNQIDYILRKIYQEKKSVDSIQIQDFFNLFIENPHTQRSHNTNKQQTVESNQNIKNMQENSSQNQNTEQSQRQQVPQIQGGKTVHNNLNDYDSQSERDYSNNNNSNQDKPQIQKKQSSFQQFQQQKQENNNDSKNNTSQEQQKQQLEKDLKAIEFEKKLKEYEEKQKTQQSLDNLQEVKEEQKSVENNQQKQLETQQKKQSQTEPQFTESFKNQFASASSHQEQSQKNHIQNEAQINSKNSNLSHNQKNDGLDLDPTTSININGSQFIKEQKRQSELNKYDDQENKQQNKKQLNEIQESKQSVNQDNSQNQIQKQQDDQNENNNKSNSVQNNNEGDYEEENFEDENQNNQQNEDNFIQANPSQRTEYTNKTGVNDEHLDDDLQDDDEIEL